MDFWKPARIASRKYSGYKFHVSDQKLCACWRARGFQIGFGVGLASGPATVGRIGYESRFDYTAIGSVVNLAARLCASAADREILMDAKVAEAIKDRRPLKGLGNRPLKGYDEAMPVFGISFDAPSRT